MEFQNVDAGLLAQFTAQLTQLVFAGPDKWNQANTILHQLNNDLMSFYNPSTVLTNAVAQLDALLNSKIIF